MRAERRRIEQLAARLGLAEFTGVLAKLAGPSNPDGAARADIRYPGVTTDADTDAAVAFAPFSVSEGSAATLAIVPEGKFPVRRVLIVLVDARGREAF